VRKGKVQKTLFSYTGPLAIGDPMERKPTFGELQGRW
jgi:hypothetical protein